MGTKRLKPKESTVKSLFAKSGNQCAFTDCNQELVDSSGNVIGEICHIEAANKGGARFNNGQTNEDRRKEENLILLCPTHHVLTNDEDEFTVDKLVKMKSSHQEMMQSSTFSISDELAEQALKNYHNYYISQDITNSGSGVQNNYFYNNSGSVSNDTEEDLGIISEIFDYVLDKLKTGIGDDFNDTRNIFVDDKIKLNFPDKEDAEDVSGYFKFAYQKIGLITAKYRMLDTEDQKDIAAFINLQYSKLKRSKSSNVEILHELFDHFIPAARKSNPKYVALSQAFVLFFFDDCTIFEKTIDEKTKQTNLPI
jgi:hypothetical protein